MGGTALCRRGLRVLALERLDVPEVGSSHGVTRIIRSACHAERGPARHDTGLFRLDRFSPEWTPAGTPS
jgi:hypothetical protein